MSFFRCNWNGRCKRRPYAEAFRQVCDECGEDESSWSYLCFWHYIAARLTKGKNEYFCKVDTDRQVAEDVREQMWDIQGDLMAIKKKLGIEEKKEKKEDFKGYQ